ncbi:MAG TPA: FaeA/PapI family transcriptional regulator [archaeon]|nr:FaeA/PapI family transcriptional regulator [archaeon]
MKRDIDKEILKYMDSLPFSATTEMVAKALGIAWYTAQMHLMKLRDEGKLKFFRIGRQNQFILASKMK